MQYQPSTWSGKYREKSCPCCNNEGSIISMKYDQDHDKIEHTYICNNCNIKWKEQYAVMYVGFTDGKYRYGAEGDAFQFDQDADLARHNFGEVVG